MSRTRPFDYSPIHEHDFDLPGGERIALLVFPNIEHFVYDAPWPFSPSDHAPMVRDLAVQDYGVRVGVWRLMDVLDRHDLTATVALNALVCEHTPQIVEAGMERDWEWMGHGLSNSYFQYSYEDREAERAAIEQTRDIIADFTGERPRGWLGPALTETFDTPELLAEAGFTYLCDWCGDDQPYPMNVPTGNLLGFPYSSETNDFAYFLRRNMTGPEFEQALTDHFDTLYAEAEEPGNAKVMSVCLHTHLAGQPANAPYLDTALEYITSHDDIWHGTAGELADYYYETYL